MTTGDPIREAEPSAYAPKIDRRAALAWIGAASIGGAAVLGRALATHGSRTPAATTAGYGNDPNLTDPSAPWPRLMTPLQLQTTALLCDYILPASGPHPSASHVGVPDFMNEWVSAPYPEQLEDRRLILAGLDHLEHSARGRHHASILTLEPGLRDALFGALAEKPVISLAGRFGEIARLATGGLSDALAASSNFYRRFRLLTAGAYYTSDEGFRDIGYVGNVALASYPGVSDEVKALLDARLKTLNL